MTRHLPHEARRAQILDAARLCFLEAGYHATKVAGIAARAGLSKGAVYFHFSNKRTLVEALVEREFARARGALAAALAAARGGDLVGGGALALLEFLGDPSDPRHRFFLLSGELAVHDDALRARLVNHHQELLAGLEALLEAWAGALPAVERRGVAVLIKAMADGLQGSLALGVAVDPGGLLAGLSALIRLGADAGARRAS